MIGYLRIGLAPILVLITGLLAVSQKLVLAAEPELDREFASPPIAYGPSCFWWWFGGDYTVQDIRENLDAMKAAGLGGFRIFPIYSLTEGDPSHRFQSASYLSPGFLELTREAVQYGSKLGMAPESLLGTGWPFGGPYIPPDMGAGQLKFFSQEVIGPRTFSGPIPGEAKPPEDLLALQMAQVDTKGEAALETVLDLTSKVQHWKIERWEVPPGRCLLMTFVKGYTGMKVKRASPGGEGLVLDHFSREALALHLKNNGDVQAPYLRGAASVTMDSWEVFGSNWTPGFPDEFQRRRGYSLLPYLSAVFLPTGETGARVRYDFRRTLSELALENFFIPLHDWAHAKAFGSRVEAHGTPADILEAYGVNDFPEAESYGEQDRRQINVRDRKLASAAAHLFGRNQVSCESFTWLRFPLFRVTLENMKAAADASYLDGINHINYHGVPLSPSWVEPPGWYYYASTFVGRGNTWWPHLKHLSEYLRRSNYLLQQGNPVSDVAVYLPYEDVWSNAFGSWYDLAGGLEERFSRGGSSSTIEMLAVLQDGGFSFDFINARRLQEAVVRGPYVHAGPMHYRVLVLPDVEAIEPAVLERLRDFCRSGGTVIAAHRVPERAPGLLDAQVADERVRALVREIFGDVAGPQDHGKPRSQNLARANRNLCGVGEGIFIPVDAAQGLAPGTHWLPSVVSKAISADLVLEPPDRQVGFVHRHLQNRDIYFLANVSDRKKSLRARFRVAGAFPRLFDAESGSVEPLYQFRPTTDSTEANLTLNPWGSAFIIFEPSTVPSVRDTNVSRILKIASDGTAMEAEADANGKFFAHTATHKLSASIHDLPASLALSGPWLLTLGSNPPRTLDELVSWTQFPEFREFSGTASYRSEFSLSEAYSRPQTRLELDIGEVQDIAEVFINGVETGVVWKHPYSLDVTGAVKAGRNQLDIRVTNRLFNSMLSRKPLPPPYTDLRDRITQPLSSGLLGPVRLRPSRRITLTPREERAGGTEAALLRARAVSPQDSKMDVNSRGRTPR
jgi:alpha-L-rhamnosidase